VTGLPEYGGGAAFTERSGECVAELLVVGFELADAGGCCLQPAQQ
jgi:hypothetical protein